jgi:hypothetical protein
MQDMQNQESPQILIDEIMKHFPIDRETAIVFAVRTAEATFRVEGEFTEEKVQEKLVDLLLSDSRNRAPWYVSFSRAHYGKHIPVWTKLVNEAIERGQDPATKLSITDNVIMEQAVERVKLVTLSEEGKSIEEVTEASFVFDDERSDDELRELIAKQSAF